MATLMLLLSSLSRTLLKCTVLDLQVALYFNKFTGVCQSGIHECKLNFLRIICDHDLFVEMPGRDPTERWVY